MQNPEYFWQSESIQLHAARFRRPSEYSCGHVRLPVRAAQPERRRGADIGPAIGDELDGAHDDQANQTEHLPAFGNAEHQTER